MTTSAPAALLFDMDGTLVDTEPYWMDAEVELITSWGGSWTHEEALTVVGSGLQASARVFQSRGVDLPTDEIIDILTDKVMARIDERLPWRPGAQELLAEARAAGLSTALVTMSMYRMAHRVADAMPAGSFDVVVPGNDVIAKPHPDPYLRAAGLLGIDPRDAVAIEDSEPGVASAVAAGCTVIAVPLHLPLPLSPDYTLWNEGLGDRTLDDVFSVHAAQAAPSAPTK